ncbi:hypothetical protein [Bradyrhizobium sp. sBnM-33]|uniref:hypothetical protein n=1 Tax=Bradyrhizobium sp. sBnM-33 TaxID=2831780 RepID=UPI001BCF0C9E|nr:hypothetical protein [Bradyrhizobium sp. sBnM-33]
MAEDKGTKKQAGSSRTGAMLGSGHKIKLPTLTQDQKQYLSRIQSSEDNPDLNIPLGGPRAPSW